MGLKLFMRKVWLNTAVGLVLLAPIMLTIVIVNFVFSLVVKSSIGMQLSRVLRRVLPAGLQQAGYIEISIQVLVFLIVVFALFMVGFIFRSIMGRKLYTLGDRLLTHIPGINRIYVFIRQISTSLIAQQKTLFKEVVLVEYPRKGVYALAFVTAGMPARFRDQVPVLGEDDYVSLFVPTTPNPTSGFFVLVSRKDIVPLNIDMSAGMKLILSGGVLYPGTEPAGEQPDLMTKLDEWFVS